MATSLKELALQIRPLIEQAAESLTDNEALRAIHLFQKWQAGRSYSAGTRVKYNNKLYRCTRAHTSRDAWNPEDNKIMWEEVVHTEEPEPTIPEWDSNHGAYSKNDKVIYEGSTWESTINNNIWTPGIYGWNRIS